MTLCMCPCVCVFELAFECVNTAVLGSTSRTLPGTHAQASVISAIGRIITFGPHTEVYPLPSTCAHTRIHTQR